MNRTTQRLLFIVLVVVLVGSVHGVNYMYLSQYEMTIFGDRIKFWHEDTCGGPVHSNSQIAIMENPVFYDLVTQAGPENDFWRGSDYNPQFLGPDPIFHALPVTIPDSLYYYRRTANHYYNPGAYHQMRCRISGSQVTMWTWYLGIAFDSMAPGTVREDFAIDSAVCIFTETQLELMGYDIIGDVVIASAKRIRIMNDVRVGGPTSGPPEYRVYEDNPNYVVIASEGEIKIANTPANGRNNSNGYGFGQSDQDSTNVVLTAAIYALDESFTFEQQNDPDSGYVCECPGDGQDNRGTLYLYGALTQRRRGYLHRGTLGSTGYAKQTRYDERLRYRPNVVIEIPTEGETTDSVNFGNVPVGTAVWDTANIYLPYDGTLGNVMATWPFYAVRTPPYSGMHFLIPVRFIPPHIGLFTGMLQVTTSFRLYHIPIRGRGVTGGAPPPIPDPGAYPNPFNATTMFRFNMQTAGNVKLEVFDIQGRHVRTLMDAWQSAGAHQVSFNAENLPSGLYIARLIMPDRVRNVKLLLIK